MDYKTAEVRLMMYCIYIKCTTFIKIIICLEILTGAMVLTVGSLMTIDFFSFYLTYQQQRSLITYVTCAFIIYGVSCMILGISLFIMRWKITLVKFGGIYLVARNVLTCLQLMGFIFMLVLVLSFNNSTHVGMSSISNLFGGFSVNNPQNFQLLINAKLLDILLINCLGIMLTFYGFFISWLIQESLSFVDDKLLEDTKPKQLMVLEMVRKKYKPNTVVPEGETMAVIYQQLNSPNSILLTTKYERKQINSPGDSFCVNNKSASTEGAKIVPKTQISPKQQITKTRNIQNGE